MGCIVHQQEWRKNFDQALLPSRDGPEGTLFCNAGSWEGPAGRWSWMHFDNDRAPRAHVDFFHANFDGNICVSEAVKVALLKSGIDEGRLAVVQNGIDTELFSPEGDALDIPGTDDRFVFLMTGAMSARKGIDIALDAYAKEFSEHDPVALVVRNYSYGQDAWCRRLIADWRASVGPDEPRVIYIYETWTPEQMAGAYRRAAEHGAYLAPCRVEGFGLTGLEALACGCRLGTTGWSGVLEYATRENAELFGYRMKPSENNLVMFADGEQPMWAEPSMKDVQRWMRRVYEERPDRERQGRVASEIHEKFTYRRMAEGIARVLRLEPNPEAASEIATEEAPRRTASPGLPPPVAPRRLARGQETLGVGIPTRDRPGYLLALLGALWVQSRRPDAVCIVNDGDVRLPEDPAVRQFGEVWERSGVPFRIVDGTGRGASPNHQRAAEMLATDLVLRLDDDLVPSSGDFVEILYRQINGRPDVGAVAGVYPRWNDGQEHVYAQESTDPGMANSVEDMRRGLVPLQFRRYSDDAVVQCEHLYSSWIYRRDALMNVGGFADCYSRFGQREETDASVRLRLLAGLKLLVVTSACAYHFHASGGRRPEGTHQAYQHDITTFEERYAGWIRAGRA